MSGRPGLYPLWVEACLEHGYDPPLEYPTDEYVVARYRELVFEREGVWLGTFEGAPKPATTVEALDELHRRGRGLKRVVRDELRAALGPLADRLAESDRLWRIVDSWPFRIAERIVERAVRAWRRRPWA